MILSESDRELVIDYIARERAQYWVSSPECHGREWGWSTDDEEVYYRILRIVGVPFWDWKPLEEQTDAELLAFYIAYYDLEPDFHMMDLWVTSKIFALAWN
jgi:hypothetical protein